MKTSGSMKSLLQGVSQQIAYERRSGQHTEQINMLPDPVQGLSRRWGSKWVAESTTTLDPSLIAAYTTDTNSYRTFEYSNNGNDFVVMRRTAAKAASSTLPPVIVFNRTTKQFLNYTRNVTDAVLDQLEAGGVSGITAIGKYVFMAGYNIVPTASSVDLWGASSNQQESAVWIRGGAYARTFTVTATRTDNTVFTFSYKTPTSSYPGTLDTSGIPVYAADPAGGTIADTESCYIQQVGALYQAKLSWGAWTPTSLTAKKGATTMTNVYPSTPTTALQYSYNAGDNVINFAAGNLGALDVTMTYTHVKTVTNPNYAKAVNDATNAFNTAVTNWIGTAADAITPNAIAEQLRLAAIAAGLTGALRNQSTVYFSNVKTLVVSDGGDNTLIRGVANEVTAVDQVTTIHKVGKVISVRARDSAEAFYLVAQAKDPSITSGYTEVTWVESAGTQFTITSALIYATASGSNFYVASTAALLNTLIAGPAPTYTASTAGDANSSPLPFFIGRQITYLGIFQDRLVIGCGAVVRLSKISDYLNFFRSSILTAPADDPLEMLSQGSEDDVLRFSVIYDRDLVIFGDKRQYAISGRSALTPTSPNMPVMSSHANAALVPPLTVGNIIFYALLGDTAASVYQLQPGQISESPESYLQSSQIDTYLMGNIIEFSNNAKPSHLFARTTGARNTIFCYTYLDNQQNGRVQDAWHKLNFDKELGPIVGMSPTPSGLLVYTIRVAKNFAGTLKTYLVADLVPLTTGLAPYPYLDSIRTLTQVNTNTGSVSSNSAGDWFVAFDGTSEWKFVGSDLSDQAGLLAEFPSATGPQVGHNQDCLFTPTNPFILDRDGKAVTSGIFTITTLAAGTKASSGFWTDITNSETTVSQEYNARIVGSPDDLVGRETITNYSQVLPIALETRDYTISFRGRTWLPFTLSTLDWVGQWFNRAPRL